MRPAATALLIALLATPATAQDDASPARTEAETDAAPAASAPPGADAAVEGMSEGTAAGEDAAAVDEEAVEIDPATLDPESLAPVVDEINPTTFVRSSIAGLAFTVRASKLALERPVSPSVRALAEELIDASETMIDDLVSAIRSSRRIVPPDALRIAEGETPRNPNALDARLARVVANLRNAEENDFEALWLGAMADGLESAQRWWSRYAYRAEDETIRMFAESRRQGIARLFDRVQETRLDRFRS